MRLNELCDNPGSTRNRARVGRGIGSGTGKTAGHGHKGQKSRSGVAIKGFEGGQMPLYRRLPKRGFNNRFSKNYTEINVGQIQSAIDCGKIQIKKGPITEKTLLDAGLITRIGDGVRLLGKGSLAQKVNIEVSGATGGALRAFESLGGIVELIEPKPKDRIEIMFQYSKPIDARKVRVIGFGKWKDYKFNEI
mgnify:CR=1 FL=1